MCHQELPTVVNTLPGNSASIGRIDKFVSQREKLKRSAVLFQFRRRIDTVLANNTIKCDLLNL